MKGATTTATRMTRATCWVLTSARRAPTRGAWNGFEFLDEEEEEEPEEEEAPTFLFSLLSALPRTETTCRVQSREASLPARGATAAARGRDQASPAKAAAIVRARSHETSELFFF